MLWIVTVTALGVLLAVAIILQVRGPGSPQEALSEGLKAHTAGDLEKAEHLYAQVLEDEPRNKFAHYNLGLLSQNAGNLKQAEKFYEKALETDPRFLPALFNLALVTEGSGRNQRAAEIYRQIVRLYPNQAAAHHNLGLLLKRKLGNAAEGDAELARAAQLDPRLSGSQPAPAPQPAR